MPQFFGRAGVGHDPARDGADAAAAAHLALLEAPDLRRLDDALKWVASELVTRFGFDRIMVLQPAENLLTIAETTYSEQPAQALEAQANAADNPVRLHGGSLEVEMMRRRAPAIVVPVDDPRAWHPITDQLGTPAYVAAPIEAFGRTVATVHGDFHFSGRDVDGQDRAALGAFAAVCRVVLERALLFEEIAGLRATARANAEALLAAADAEYGDGFARAPDPVGHRHGWSLALPHSPLTPRENDVLALMSRGATSQEIARRLVISIGTVKTHARSILKKLGASTRAEAVARAIQLQRMPPRAGP